MPIVPNRDMGEFIQIAGHGGYNATAAGTGDATEVTGATINRQSYGNPESATIFVGHKTSLTATKVLALTVKIQESADGSSWDTAETLASAVTVATATGSDTYTFKVKLSDRKQYVRTLVTPDLSAAGTDTAVGSFGLIMGPGRDTALLDAPDGSDE